MSSSTQTITLVTPDMSCAHCVSTIEQALASVDGVGTVQVSLETRTVTMEVDPDDAAVARVRDALKEAGYPAT